MDGLKQVYAQVAGLLGKLSPRARALATLVVLVGAVTAIGVALWGGGPQRTLFSGLDPRDASAVVSVLDSAKIEYELGADGTVIRVAASEVDRARILLAEQDLPRTGNVGFELFENQSFGLTDFAQRVNYRRALQGEIERTIIGLDSVGAARVHITQPKRAVFEDEKVEPKASVTVDLLPGKTLSERRVGAIRHLVAAAVEGLEPHDVTVVDTKGNLLSRSGVGEDAAGAALDHESSYEHDVEQRLTRLLERTVGVGGAEVRVAADFDFSKTDTTEEVFDPEQTAVRSESTQEVVEGAGGGAPRGVAGAQANTPGAAAAGATAGRGGSSRVVKNKNYEVNKTVVRTRGPDATLKRMTVAVLVDGTYTTPEGGGEPVFTARTDDELAQLRTVVESAIGLNATRGDKVEIASVQFRDRPSVDDALSSNVGAMPPWITYAAGGGALGAVALAWLIVARRRRKNPTITPEILALPTTVGAAQQAIAQVESGQLPGTDRAALPEAAAPGAEDVLALASKDPERTADIIRSWMTADEQ